MEGQVTWGEAPLPSEVAQQLGWEGVKPQHLLVNEGLSSYPLRIISGLRLERSFQDIH